MGPILTESPDLGRARFDEPVAVVGDVHGRLDLLDRLLTQLPDSMPVLFLGDLCDRGGPDTRGVVQRLMDRGAVGVRGNHEEWLISWLNGEPFDPEVARHMGGETTLRSYGLRLQEAAGRMDAVPEAQRAWLCALPVALDLEVCGAPYWLAHAGVSALGWLGGLPLAQVVPHLAAHHPEELLWPKMDPGRMRPVDRPVIMGHIPQPRVRDLGHVIAVDTGSGRTEGRLSAVVLPERRVLSAG